MTTLRAGATILKNLEVGGSHGFRLVLIADLLVMLA
jgi:hypothetical protein